jgi:hypothetical protein
MSRVHKVGHEPRKNSRMTPGHYREAFEEHLDAVLNGEFPNVRLRMFIDRLECLLFICERCWEEFEVSASEVDEDAPILCQKCQKVKP